MFFSKPIAPSHLPPKPHIIPPPQSGIDLIESFEKCRLKAFLDPGGIPTIAWGHTREVKLGDVCTQAQADAWKAEDCAWAWAAVEKHVKVPLTDNQAGALLSFVYNMGEPAFAKTERTGGLLAILNAGKYSAVPCQMRRFVWITLADGSRKVCDGLVNRRKAEVNLWNGGDWRVG